MARVVRAPDPVTAASLPTNPALRFSGAPLEGHRIGGRYTIERPLARGTWARLYEAWDEREERTVALKVLASEQDDVARRFEIEARTAGEVRHPNVLDVYDRGHLDDGTPFMVMELLEGQDLAAHLEQGVLPVAAVVDLGRQLAAALVALESHGVVHRDLKPQNIVIHHEGDRIVAKLVDFGVSKRRGLAPDVSDGGVVMGTPYYLSPQQVKGDPVNVRSDLFSLGVVLYEALTGRHPHGGDSVGALAASILEGPVPPIGERRPECPRSLARLVERLLAKSPGDRPEHAREVHEELGRIGAELALPRGTEAWEEPRDTRTSGVPARGRKRWAWLAIVALLVLAGATAWGWIGPW